MVVAAAPLPAVVLPSLWLDDDVGQLQAVAGRVVRVPLLPLLHEPVLVVALGLLSGVHRRPVDALAEPQETPTPKVARAACPAPEVLRTVVPSARLLLLVWLLLGLPPHDGALVVVLLLLVAPQLVAQRLGHALRRPLASRRDGV
ncbi:hypothetical protein [Mumia zhuanghuii]|uniref:Uncharacterized protein n=1 Tax=Mumia zhuanghuii TaxID=2585211 RepID=A0A5C4MHE6_9ACTN|nr:hypothetical protein [Mumia zhuanghuii]TNC35588.1 hypothetical protein FHE65_26945 [Mumia zhuanghuii]